MNFSGILSQLVRKHNKQKYNRDNYGEYNRFCENEYSKNSSRSQKTKFESGILVHPKITSIKSDSEQYFGVIDERFKLVSKEVKTIREGIKRKLREGLFGIIPCDDKPFEHRIHVCRFSGFDTNSINNYMFKFVQNAMNTNEAKFCFFDIIFKKHSAKNSHRIDFGVKAYCDESKELRDLIFSKDLLKIEYSIKEFLEEYNDLTDMSRNELERYIATKKLRLYGNSVVNYFSFDNMIIRKIRYSILSSLDL